MPWVTVLNVIFPASWMPRGFFGVPTFAGAILAWDLKVVSGIWAAAGAAASDAAVTAAWRRYGYAVIDLPLAPVAERLAFLRAAMGL